MNFTPTMVFGVAVLAIPAAAFVLLAALTALPGRREERTVVRLATGALWLSLLASVATVVDALGTADPWGPQCPARCLVLGVRVLAPVGAPAGPAGRCVHDADHIADHPRVGLLGALPPS